MYICVCVYVCYRGLFMDREMQLSLCAIVQLSTDILKASPYFFIVFIQICLPNNMRAGNVPHN